MKRIAIACCFLMPALAQATGVWSDCETITAVSDEPAISSILVTLSPGISGCAAQGVVGAINFTTGQFGITSTDLGGLLATSLSAYAIGKRVMVAYDNSTINCYSQAIAISGYSNQCP